MYNCIHVKNNHHYSMNKGVLHLYLVYMCICHLGIHKYIYAPKGFKRVLLFIPTQSIVDDGIKTRWSRAGINSTVLV